VSRPSFVHLHNHTEFSLLDGACRLTDDKGKPGELLKEIAAMKMPALAITDHGNLYGAVEFYQAARSVQIKPILGCEMYLAPRSRRDRTSERGMEDAYSHLTLLARDNEGYQNLIQLCSIGFLEGYYYKPRVDKEVLARYSKGLIALSGCLKGELAQALLAEKDQQARDLASQYQDIFGKGHYYLEMMDHGIAEQKRLNPKLLEFSKTTGIPLVATNDCHYLKKEDAPVHDALLCIGTGSTISEAKRLRFEEPEFYYKSPEEMESLFSYCPEAVRRTLEVAERCNVEIRFDQMLLPHYEVPTGETPDRYLETLCRQGLRGRYGDAQGSYAERLAYELSVIHKMGFSTYFLIVWDFVQWAKANSIPVGPGRGSGAGSLVSYTLGITDICPVKYGLLFERFLNPDRRSMPDLDIDFSDEGRDRVIQYVRSKYGEKSVAQIITFGSMLARLVVRDVGRVMGMPLADVDRIAKLIPRELGTTLAMARKNVVELQRECEQNPEVDRMLAIAGRLEGLKRHTGVHAAGIVIAKGDLTQYVPLAKGAKDVITTQFNDEALLKMGLLKMDFLGLRTLTVIDQASRLIRERHRPDFDVKALPLDDAATFKLLQEARSVGVFQLESGGMRDLLRKLHPSVFEEIIALIALYRPGPMGAGMLDEFVKRKHNAATIKYDHPILEPILKETYGIILYQEQAMQISRDFAGFPPGQADILRKAMAKKIPEELEKLRGQFMEGAKAKGIKDRIAHQVYEQIVTFGGYGFNKSHSTAYGLVSYQTAYLKANYPLEFMTALLTSEIGHSAIGREEESKLVGFLSEAGAMDIQVRPPDVQKSYSAFTVEDDAIRFGLLAVKNVGAGSVDSIVQSRTDGGTFKSVEDFCRRVDLRQANRKVLESLAKAGAFDPLSAEPPNQFRPKILAQLDDLMARAAKIREEAERGQNSLFGWHEMSPQKNSPPPLWGRTEVGGSSPPSSPSPIKGEGSMVDARSGWSEHELLANEKEVLGFYLSGHPLARFQGELRLFSSHNLGKLPSSGSAVRIAGMLANVRRLVTKAKKEPYARCRFEDLEGEVDLIIFPKAYAAGASRYLKPSEMVVVTGKVNRRAEDGTAEILAEELVPLAQAREQYVSELLVRLSAPGVEEKALEDLKETLARYPGRCRVCVEVNTPPKGSLIVETDLTVKPSSALLEEIEKRLGHESWKITKVGR
jgi:DNA polymerase III subunit alpha